MARRFSTTAAGHLPGRRILHLMVVTAVVGAVVALAVTRSGVPASAMRLLTGDAWLENASAGTVTHVNGYSGSADAQAAVARPGDPFEVVQRSGGAFVLDWRTGRLLRLDDSSLNVTAAVVEPEPAKALQVITGTKATWILDRSSGVLQEVNPTTLKPLGHQLALGGPTGPGVIDGSGAVWVPLRSKAGVVQVNPGGRVIHHAFGEAGTDIQLADTSTGVWAVDSQAKRAASMSVPGARPVTLPALPKAPLVGASGSSPDLVLVSGGEVLGVDTARPSLSSLAVPAAASVTQVAVSSKDAYLLDPQARRLDTVDLSPLGVAGSTPVPAGADQLVEKDQLLFVNSTTTPQALVVNPNGTVTDVNKYTPHVPPHHVGPMPGPPGPAPHNPLPQPPLPQPPLPQPPSPPLTSPPITSPSPPPPTPPSTGAPFPSPSPTSPPSTSPPAPVPSPTTVFHPAPPAPTPQPSTPPTTVPRPTVPPTTVPPTTTPPTTPTTSPPTTAARTVPGAPTVSKVTAGNGQVTATWSPPASDGGSPIVRYQVTGSPDVVAVSVSAPTITATLTGLPNGTSECVQVQALNAVGGGPLSPAGQSCATPVPPAAVPNRPPSLSVSDGNGSLTISWGAASVGLGSPPVTHYELSVNGGGSQPAVSPTTIGATAWATEQISVYAVNAVGNGAAAAATGVAWNRQPAVICFNATSGDRSIRDACDQANNFQQQGNAGFDIVEANPNSGHAQPSAFNERLCTGYYTANQGDHYALLTSPSQNCPTALAGAQNPAVAHTIAFVSSGSLGDSDSRHICEYTGQTSGTQGTFTQQELSPCGSPPPGMTGAVQGFDFWT